MSNHDVSSRLREVLKSDKKVTLGAMVDKVSAQKEIKQNVEMKNDVSSKKESGDDLREKELSILKEQYA
ncbi:hypothetical protein SH917_21530, partial [Acinetobacter baumannii]|nr:hypothetical protein [Acinetobacter baumannii]